MAAYSRAGLVAGKIWYFVLTILKSERVEENVFHLG